MPSVRENEVQYTGGSVGVSLLERWEDYSDVFGKYLYYIAVSSPVCKCTELANEIILLMRID